MTYDVGKNVFASIGKYANIWTFSQFSQIRTLGEQSCADTNGNIVMFICWLYARTFMLHQKASSFILHLVLKYTEVEMQDCLERLACTTLICLREFKPSVGMPPTSQRRNRILKLYDKIVPWSSNWNYFVRSSWLILTIFAPSYNSFHNLLQLPVDRA